MDGATPLKTYRPIYQYMGIPQNWLSPDQADLNKTQNWQLSHIFCFATTIPFKAVHLINHFIMILPDSDHYSKFH